MKFVVTFADDRKTKLDAEQLKSVILDGLGFPTGLDDQLSVAEAAPEAGKITTPSARTAAMSDAFGRVWDAAIDAALAEVGRRRNIERVKGGMRGTDRADAIDEAYRDVAKLKGEHGA